MKNFLAACRSRNYKQLNAEIEIGAMSAALCHLANISYRVGRKLTWDEAKRNFVNDSEANKLLTRDYRKPYVVCDPTRRTMMTQVMDRRRWMQRVAQSLAACGPPARCAPSITTSRRAGIGKSDRAANATDLLLFRWNNRPIGAYRAHSSQKYPYFYPLAGPVTGLSLLAESALPYPHHRGLWLGCQPMNGGDYWGDTSLDTGHIRSTALQLGKANAAVRGVYRPRANGSAKTRLLRLRTRGHSLSMRSTTGCGGWMPTWSLTAREDITIKSAKHSFFALRVIPELSPLYGGVW